MKSSVAGCLVFTLSLFASVHPSSAIEQTVTIFSDVRTSAMPLGGPIQRAPLGSSAPALARKPKRSSPSEAPGLLSEKQSEFGTFSSSNENGGDEDNNEPAKQGPEPPKDVFDLGYNDFFDGLLNRPAEGARFGLGVGYNDYFKQTISEFSAANAQGGFRVNTQPTYLSNGFWAFRSVSKWQTRGYALGYYGAKIAVGVFGASKVTGLFGKTAQKVLGKFSEQVSDLFGEATAEVGSYFDNADVMSHNAERMLQILENPDTYRTPFSPWPDLR